MTLYEIEIAIANCIDEDGEIVDVEKLEALQMERESKLENVALWIKNLNAEADALKAEKNALYARQKSAENKAERLKEYLANALNGDKLKTTRVAVSFRKSTAVEVDPLAELPEQFTKIRVEPDKTELKKALASGELVEGAKLVERVNLVIK